MPDQILCLPSRKVFTQRENYERLLADNEDRLAKVGDRRDEDKLAKGTNI